MGSIRNIDEAVIVRACDMFIRGEKNSAIVTALNEELAALNDDRELKREDVYRLLAVGRQRRYFTFTPPQRVALQTRVADTFNVPQSRVHVANSRSIDVLAATAAKLLVELIVELGKKHEEVHVGLGGGYTARLVSSHLATQLRGVADLPQLVLHALSTGFDPHGHHTAPVTFFGFFEGIVPEVKYVGLFAPPVVDTDQYEKTIGLVSVKESFEARKQLHLVVTALGSASHEHGDFHNFMKLGDDKKGVKVLKDAGWVGDVQYRPYSKTGPITDETEIRAVSLLDLDELVAMANSDDKHVVVSTLR